MPDKEIPKIIFEFKGKQYEIPLYLRRVSMNARFDDVLIVDIEVLCQHKEDVESWEQLMRYISPWLNSQK